LQIIKVEIEIESKIWVFRLELKLH